MDPVGLISGIIGIVQAFRHSITVIEQDKTSRKALFRGDKAELDLGQTDSVLSDLQNLADEQSEWCNSTQPTRNSLSIKELNALKSKLERVQVFATRFRTELDDKLKLEDGKWKRAPATRRTKALVWATRGKDSKKRTYAVAKDHIQLVSGSINLVLKLIKAYVDQTEELSLKLCEYNKVQEVNSSLRLENNRYDISVCCNIP
jgi:hypothetical protein